MTTYKTSNVDGVNIFYREAGSTSSPTILLLHGHASASHTFRNLIPLITDSFHVIAPDYPGFGQSDMPSSDKFQYNFVNIANYIDKFTENIGLKKFYIYVFDYGAPVGFMIACKHPERIAGIFSQSGNAYEDGLSPAFEGLRAFWKDPKGSRQAADHLFSTEGVKGAYALGLTDTQVMSPDAPTLDLFYLHRPGALEIQEAMLFDYQNNLKVYPEWQEYLRKHKPKVICIWGKDDPFFTPPGAEAFKRDVPNADVTIIDAAHFVNEIIPDQIAAGVKKLLK